MKHICARLRGCLAPAAMAPVLLALSSCGNDGTPPLGDPLTLRPGQNLAIYEGSGERDVLIMRGGGVEGAIEAGDGGDRVELHAGNVGGAIQLGGGDDRLLFAGDLTGGALVISGLLDGGAGDDTLEIAEGGAAGGILFTGQGAGDDLRLRNFETVTLRGGRVNRGLTAGASALTFILESGEINGAITGGGDDVFRLSGGRAGHGVALQSGERLVLEAGGGSDLLVYGETALPENAVLSGGADEDALEIDLATLENARLSDLELVSALNGEWRAGGILFRSFESATITDGSGEGEITLDSGTLPGLDMGGGDDRITITGDATQSGLVIQAALDGGAGGDTLELSEDGVVAAIMEASGAPASGAVHIQNVETILIGGGSVAGAITGGAGNQAFIFSSGAVGGDVSGGAGTDQFSVLGDLTGANPALALSGMLDGGTDFEEDGMTPSEVQSLDLFLLGIGGTAAGITFDATDMTARMVRLTGIEVIQIEGGRVSGAITGGEGNQAFIFSAGEAGGDVSGGAGEDSFSVFGALTGSTPALTLSGILDGGTDFEPDGMTPSTTQSVDVFTLGTGGAAAGITFDAADMTAGVIRLSRIEQIAVNGGSVSGSVAGGDGDEVFEMTSGLVTGNVLGGGGDDRFMLGFGFMLGGHLDGGGGTDTLVYDGAPSDNSFAGRGGLDPDADITDNSGDVRNIESQMAPAQGAGVRTEAGVHTGVGVHTALNIERLELSPALLLSGTMSDALMEFGAKTAEGISLAGLDLSAGRAKSLVSRIDPVSENKIWAHQIRHEGRRRGSMGLALRGLTARAGNTYDYNMQLTGQGLDAQLGNGRGASLRLATHALEGGIELQGASARVEGWGAGAGLLWRQGGFAARLTALAALYEVEASALSFSGASGFFSAFNTILSAELSGQREIGPDLRLRGFGEVIRQSLTLDNFVFQGPEGIAIDFESASRLTARFGASLGSEHWFADLALVHETESGGALTSGLRQNYRPLDGTAFEARFGGRIADLLPGLTLKADAGLRAPFGAAGAQASASFGFSWKF